MQRYFVNKFQKLKLFCQQKLFKTFLWFFLKTGLCWCLLQYVCILFILHWCDTLHNKTWSKFVDEKLMIEKIKYDGQNMFLKSICTYNFFLLQVWYRVFADLDISKVILTLNLKSNNSPLFFKWRHTHLSLFIVPFNLFIEI